MTELTPEQWKQLRQEVGDEREANGLSRTITNPTVLDQIAAIVQTGEGAATAA